MVEGAIIGNDERRDGSEGEGKERGQKQRCGRWRGGGNLCVFAPRKLKSHCRPLPQIQIRKERIQIGRSGVARSGDVRGTADHALARVAHGQADSCFYLRRRSWRRWL
jgi:hypothetical protein